MARLTMCMVLLVSVCAVTMGYPFKLFRRQTSKISAVPSGYSVERFVEICEICGMYYGSHRTYTCISDTTFKTFKGCSIAVE